MYRNISSLPLANNTSELVTSSVFDVDVVGEEKNAFVYVVVVLGFYFIGITSLMIKYMKREKEDFEAEKSLEKYLKTAPRSCFEQRATPSGRLALGALNTINILTQPKSADGRITFV